MIGALLFFLDLVITSHISLELANTVWPKLETCVIHLIHKWPPTWEERATKHGIEAFWDKT